MLQSQVFSLPVCVPLMPLSLPFMTKSGFTEISFLITVFFKRLFITCQIDMHHKKSLRSSACYIFKSSPLQPVMSKSHVPELFDDQDTLSLVTPGKMMAMTQPDLFFLTNFLCLLYKLFELSKSRPVSYWAVPVSGVTLKKCFPCQFWCL